MSRDTPPLREEIRRLMIAGQPHRRPVLSGGAAAWREDQYADAALRAGRRRAAQPETDLRGVVHSAHNDQHGGCRSACRRGM